MLLFVLFSVLPLVVVAYFTYSSVSGILRGHVEEKMLQLSIDKLDAIDRVLKERVSDVQTWAALGVAKTAAQFGSGVGGASDFVNFLIKQHHIYKFIMLLDAEGTCITLNMVDRNNEPLGAHQTLLGERFQDRAWFQKALQGEQAVSTDWLQDGLPAPANSSQPPEPSLVFATAIRDSSGEVLGVWANFLDWEQIEAIFQQEQLRLSGQQPDQVRSLLLLSDNDTIIAHSAFQNGENLHGKQLSTDFNAPHLIEILSSSQQHIFSEDWEGQPTTFIFSRERGIDGYAGHQWGHLMISDTASINRPIVALRSKILLFAILLAVSASLLAYIIGHRVARPLILLSEAAAAIARGDLKHKIPFLATLSRQAGSLNEINILLDSFARMSQKLRELLRQIKHASSLINASSNQMSAALQQLSALATQQSYSIIQTTGAVEEITISSREIARSAGLLAQFAEATEQEAHTGVQAAVETLTRIKAIKHTNDDNMQHVMDLYERSKEIHQIVEVITTIADSTDLIAFNAALEAAGAGEKGRRFGVVADEIRQLANTVATSVKHIQQKISEIQQGTHGMVGAFHIETERIESGVADMKLTASSLESILDKNRKTTTSLMQISQSTTQQQTSNEHIVTALHEMSQEMGNFQNIAGKSLDTIAELKRLSDELQQSVSVFNLDE